MFVGVSVDGFLARPDGTLDFLPPGGGEGGGYDEFVAGVDVHVIGRKTYETVLAFPVWPYGRKPVIVLSSRPLAPPPAGAAVERVVGEPADVLAQLEARGFTHAYVDGGVTIQAFLRAGLIQRLVVTRVPVLVGAGISLFGALDRDVPLRHVGTRSLAGGLVQSEYAVEV